MPPARTALIILTIILAAGCTGCDWTRAPRDRAFDDPSLSSGEAAFRKANELIAPPAHGDEKAFGNTLEAKKLATKFNMLLKTMQAMFFEKGIGSVPVDVEVRTYCELSDDSVLFLVYVPELRKYTNKAQESLVEIGWMIARGTVEPTRKDLKRVNVGVGFRGVLLYGAAGMGPASGESPTRTYFKGPIDADMFLQFFGRPMTSNAGRAVESTPLPPSPLPPLNLPKRVTGTRPAHASIALVRGDRPGAAFAVGDDLLVTAVEPLLVTTVDKYMKGAAPLSRTTWELELPDGRVVEGQVVDLVHPTGLALVRVAPGVLPKLPLAQASSISAGTPVTLWSATARHGEPTQIAEARIDNVREDYGVVELDTVIGIPRRAIGGPLIDADGRVVGIATWRPGPDSPCLISAKHITELVDRQIQTAALKK